MIVSKITGGLATLLLISVHSPFASPANILFYFGLTGHSHVSSLWPVIQTLADRGHNVTLLTSMVPKSSHPDVTVVHVVDLYDIFKDKWDEGGDLVGERMAGTHVEMFDDLIENAVKTCRTVFESPVAHSLIYDSKFDLVIMDTAFNDCAFGLAYYQYKCAYILYSAVSVWTTYFDDLGLPVESSSIPDMEIGNPTPLSFFERLIATWQPIRWTFKRRAEYYPEISAILQDKLRLNSTPDFQEVYSKTSLVLLNTHYSNDYARSLPPLFVSIGGIGIQNERKPLPSNIEKFITKPGSKGFIYVSFGTAVRISKSNDELRQKFFSTFGNMSDYQFVWKWEEDIPAKGVAPSNILFAKWLPQQDILAQKNIRGYVSHGGMNGVNEAVHYGVPMVVFPIMGDQDYNGNTMASKGLAIVLEIADFAQEDLHNALNKIIYDEELRARVSRASTIFRDRPTKPVDTAVWWIEYVLRHGDTSFLMPTSVHQTWYERRLLDIWLFVFGISTLAVLAISLVITKLLSSASRSKPSKSVSPSTASKLKAN